MKFLKHAASALVLVAAALGFTHKKADPPKTASTTAQQTSAQQTGAQETGGQQGTPVQQSTGEQVSQTLAPSGPTSGPVKVKTADPTAGDDQAVTDGTRKTPPRQQTPPKQQTAPKQQTPPAQQSPPQQRRAVSDDATAGDAGVVLGDMPVLKIAPKQAPPQQATPPQATPADTDALESADEARAAAAVSAPQTPTPKGDVQATVTADPQATPPPVQTIVAPTPKPQSVGILNAFSQTPGSQQTGSQDALPLPASQQQSPPVQQQSPPVQQQTPSQSKAAAG